MGSVNHLSLRNGLLRAVAATRREIAGVKQSSRTAPPLRSFGIFVASRRPQALPRQRSQQHSVRGCCVRYGASSDGLITFDPRPSRKRPLCRRTLSSRTPYAAFVSRSSDSNGNSNNSSSRCWKCNSMVSWREYFCKCGVAQLLDERLDYFEMFDCPPSVFLELGEVEKRFKKMQRAFHPVSTSLYKQYIPHAGSLPVRSGSRCCLPTCTS